MTSLKNAFILISWKNATEKATENEKAIYKETSTEKAQYKLVKCFIISKICLVKCTKKSQAPPP